MKKRGRPSEQLKRETSEGRVWTIISKLRNERDYSKTIREIARLSHCSKAAVANTLAWKGYLQEKRRAGSLQRRSSTGRTRQRRSAESVEGRVMQIVLDARNDYSLTVRQIAEIIKCSPAAVGKTEAWNGYVRAREADKEAAQDQRR